MTALVYILAVIALLVAAAAAWRLYHELRAETSADVATDHDFAHQTWNTCPDCGHSWPDAVSTHGLLHRTRLCHACAAPPRSTNGHRRWLGGRNHHPLTIITTKGGSHGC